MSPGATDSLGVFDTSGFFGVKEVSLYGCEEEAVDERNLGACRSLEAHDSPIQRLDTRLLHGLEELTIGGARITQIDTGPLRNLKLLCVGNNRISSLDASGLGASGTWRSPGPT